MAKRLYFNPIKPFIWPVHRVECNEFDRWSLTEDPLVRETILVSLQSLLSADLSGCFVRSSLSSSFLESGQVLLRSFFLDFFRRRSIVASSERMLRYVFSQFRQPVLKNLDSPIGIQGFIDGCTKVVFRGGLDVGDVGIGDENLTMRFLRAEKWGDEAYGRTVRSENIYRGPSANPDVS